MINLPFDIPIRREWNSVSSFSLACCCILGACDHLGNADRLYITRWSIKLMGIIFQSGLFVLSTLWSLRVWYKLGKLKLWQHKEQRHTREAKSSSDVKVVPRRDIRFLAKKVQDMWRDMAKRGWVEGETYHERNLVFCILLGFWLRIFLIKIGIEFLLFVS